MQLLKSILESEKSQAMKDLVKAARLEYGVDDQVAERIADWMANNKDDKEVEELLYNHYFERMPYSAQSDDPSNWIANTVAREFKKELDALWKAGKPVK